MSVGADPPREGRSAGSGPSATVPRGKSLPSHLSAADADRRLVLAVIAPDRGGFVRTTASLRTQAAAPGAARCGVGRIARRPRRSEMGSLCRCARAPRPLPWRARAAGLDAPAGRGVSGNRHRVGSASAPLAAADARTGPAVRPPPAARKATSSAATSVAAVRSRSVRLSRDCGEEAGKSYFLRATRRSDGNPNPAQSAGDPAAHSPRPAERTTRFPSPRGSPRAHRPRAAEGRYSAATEVAVGQGTPVPPIPQ